METNQEQYDAELIKSLQHIKRRKEVELYFEKKSALENINFTLVSLDSASENFIYYSNLSKIAVREALIHTGKSELLEKNWQYAQSSLANAQYISKAANAFLEFSPMVHFICKIAYLAYDYLKKIKEQSARITYYNMLEWCRIKLELQIPKRTHEYAVSELASIAHDLDFISNFGIQKIEIENLEKADIKNFEEAYYGIMAFIFGNFIYSIDAILDSFLNDNKEQNFFRASDERKYAIDKFEERKKILCYDKMTYLFTYIARNRQFPIDYIGQLNPQQIQKINEFLTKVPDKESEYVQGSIFCFLFKTLDYALENLNKGFYKINTQNKQELMMYFKEKNEEYFDSWHEHKIHTSFFKAHYFRMNPLFEKQYAQNCNYLCHLIEKKKQKVSKIEHQNKKLCTKDTENVVEQTLELRSTTKDLGKIKTLSLYLKQNIFALEKAKKIEGKRLVCFDRSAAYLFFVKALENDSFYKNLLHFTEYKKYHEIVNISYKPNFFFDLYGFKNNAIKYKNLDSTNVFMLNKGKMQCYDLSFRNSVAGEIVKPHVISPTPVAIFIPFHFALTALLFPIPLIYDISEQETLKYVRLEFTPETIKRSKETIKQAISFLERRERAL